MLFSTILAGAVLAVGVQSHSYGNSAPPGSTAGFLDPVVLPSQEGDATCVSGLVPVEAMTTRNIMLNMDLPANQSTLTQIFVSMFSTGIAETQMKETFGAMTNVSGTYNISCYLCYPSTGINSSTIQFLTHGVGADHTYWDFAPGYSYVDVAARSGYTTFSYDRLGVGKSSKEDPLQVVQALLEVGVAHSLIQSLRKGEFALTSFEKVVGVGHSFGSGVTAGVTSEYPQDLDAAVLTGFTLNGTGNKLFYTALQWQIAAQNNPFRFGSLNNGYVVDAGPSNAQTGFFHSPDFDPEILSLAESNKATATLGELVTLPLIFTRPAKEFTGPVDIVIGEFDLPFCNGNCRTPTNIAETVKPAFYPMASNSSTTYIAPGAGHGLNWHYSATDAFDQIQHFLANNQL